MSICKACHTSRIIKAPTIGDKNAWAPRIAQGKDILLNHVIHGYKGMPPRGTCSNCSDDELKNTIEYIISRSQ